VEPSASRDSSSSVSTSAVERASLLHDLANGSEVSAGVDRGRFAPRVPPGVETPGWLMPAMAGMVFGLAALTLITTFVEPMPHSHLLIVPMALIPIAVAWALEILGLPWPRVLLAVAVAGPNIVLSAIGHVGTNYLFLLLLVAWVTYAGKPRETYVALGLSVLAVLTLAASNLINGIVEITLWIVWIIGLVTIWIAARMIRSQQHLLVEVSAARMSLDRKARETEALYQADEHLYRSLQLDSVLQGLVDAVTDILRADKCALMVWDPDQERLVVRATSGFRPETVDRMTFIPGEGIAGLVFQHGEPVAVEDTLVDPRVKHEIGDPEGIRAVVSIPIFVDGQVFGVFGVNYRNPRSFDESDIRLFESLARRAAMAISNARLYGQAQRVATLEERQRLARELHDSATQSMYSARMYAEAAGRLLERGDAETAGEYLQEIKDATRDALAEMRLLIHELRPPVLEQQGLVAALRLRLSAVEERAGVDVTFEFDGDENERLPLVLEHELYGIAQEALNNALKHGRPGCIRVGLAIADDLVRLDVRDDGTGFDPASRAQGGNGLVGMRERVVRHGGSMNIESASGAGTYVQVEVPR
jgi:signal transduction histidine kinase